MQNNLVQTSNRTKIGANLISNYTKIGINITNCIEYTKISIVPSCIKTSADFILQLTKIGAVPNCIKISANYIITNSSSIMHILYAKANYTSRVSIRRVFNNKVIQLAITLKAIQIKLDQLTSLRAPTAPFKAVN